MTEFLHDDELMTGYWRHNAETLMTCHDGDSYVVVRLADDDLIDDAVGSVMVRGDYDTVLTELLEFGVDPDQSMRDHRLDGASFVTVKSTMYMLTELAPGYGVLELTDYDFLEGRLANIVARHDDLDQALKQFNGIVAGRRSGTPPIRGHHS